MNCAALPLIGMALLCFGGCVYTSSGAYLTAAEGYGSPTFPPPVWDESAKALRQDFPARCYYHRRGVYPKGTKLTPGGAHWGVVGDMIEGLAHFRMGVQQLLVVHQHLHDAGGEDLHEVHIFSQLFIVGAAENADPGQVLGKLLHLFHRLADLLGQILHGALLAETCGDGNISLVIGDDAGQGIVLGGVLVDLVHNAGQAADDMTELDDFRSQFSHDMISPSKCNFS